MQKRSSYRVLIEGTVVCIFDLEGAVTVTDDAHNVVADIMEAGLIFERVLYRDRDDLWDEIIIKGGRFLGFRLIGEANLARAIKKSFTFQS